MARKYSILAGSKELCSEKISGIFIGNLVGPIIHCSPDLTRVRILSNKAERMISMFEKLKKFCDSFLELGVPGFDLAVYKDGECVLRYMGWL